MDISPDTKADVKALTDIVKPSSGSVVVNPDLKPLYTTRTLGAPIPLNRTTSGVINPIGGALQNQQRVSQPVTVSNAVYPTVTTSVKPNSLTDSKHLHLKAGLISTPNPKSAFVYPPPVPIISNPTQSGQNVNTITTANSVTNVQPSEFSQITPSTKLATISEEPQLTQAQLNQVLKALGIGSSKEVQTSQTPSVNPQPPPVSVSAPLGQVLQHSQINKRHKRLCSADDLAVRGFLRSSAGPDDDVASDPGADPSGDPDSEGDDLSDLEEEEDPRAVAIDEKVTVVVSAVQSLADGIARVDKKLDLLAAFLTRFAQSPPKSAPPQ